MMIKQTILAVSLFLAATSVASAGMEAYPGISKYDYWRGEACGNGAEPGSQCEKLFKRLCGGSPNAACVRRNQKAFERSDHFRP